MECGEGDFEEESQMSALASRVDSETQLLRGGILEGRWREGGGGMCTIWGGCNNQTKISDTEMVRWINRYEAQVRSGSHLYINGIGATGPDSLFQ